KAPEAAECRAQASWWLLAPLPEPPKRLAILSQSRLYRAQDLHLRRTVPVGVSHNAANWLPTMFMRIALYGDVSFAVRREQARRAPAVEEGCARWKLTTPAGGHGCRY